MKHTRANSYRPAMAAQGCSQAQAFVRPDWTEGVLSG